MSVKNIENSSSSDRLITGYLNDVTDMPIQSSITPVVGLFYF